MDNRYSLAEAARFIDGANESGPFAASSMALIGIGKTLLVIASIMDAQNRAPDLAQITQRLDDQEKLVGGIGDLLRSIDKKAAEFRKAQEAGRGAD